MTQDFQQQKNNRISLASDKQRQAADPSVSVWVEASAGTGKTKVLSDRVLRLLLSGVNPARILCLTYTKAAAVEMSNRIADRLSKWAVFPDTKLLSELQNLLGKNLSDASEQTKLLEQARQLFAILLDTPGGIKIQTIHSFCQEILKRFPLEAKISPYFEVMDDREADTALKEIKLDLLRGTADIRTTEALSWLTTVVSENSFPDILQAITSQRNLIETSLQNYSSVDDLIAAVAKGLNITPQTSAEDLINLFWQRFAKTDVEYLIKALEAGSDTSRKYAVSLASAVETKNFDTVNTILHYKRLLVEKSRKLFPQAEEIVANQKLHLDDTLNKLTAVELLKATRAVLVIAADLLKRYRLYKKSRSKMDFNDLILLTRHLLEAPHISEWILYKLDGGIDHVLIDEAQDTSPDQWAVVKSLTNEFFSGLGSKASRPTIFVVGDRKQSIYSFQGADPHEFEKTHDYFASRDPAFHQIDMEVSFRSADAILDVVNAVFSNGKACAGVIRSNQKLAHVPSRIGDGGRVELWPLIQPETDKNPDDVWLPPVERITAVSPRAKLAQQLAEMIYLKVSRGEKLKSQNRPLKYSDFLILVQQRDAFVQEFIRSCKNFGVNIAGADRIKLLQQISINDLMALADFTLLPDDDLNLACLLKSPLFGLNDDDLFTLCYDRGDNSLWQRLQQNSAYTDAKTKLQNLLISAGQMRPFEFFSHVLNTLNGRKQFIERLGFDCEDALDEFINLCLDFEREHIPSMQLFVGWMRQDDVEIKRNLEQNKQDAVRVMTVHGSKGLQAPIVILPDAMRIKTVKQEAGWLCDNGTLLYPLGKSYYENQAEKIKNKEKNILMEEYHRLLYVALTRAEDCLYICGWCKKNNISEESWYALCKKALEPIAEKQPDGRLIYETPQQFVPPIVSVPEIITAPASLPEWLTAPLPHEDPLAKPLTPSHQDETGIAALSPLSAFDDNHLYNRGRIIHKMLQFLPNAAEADRPQLATEFLQSQASDINETERKKIYSEVLSLLNNPCFAPLFSPNSMAEVALMGQVGNHIISGQIDRLVITDDKVMIIDYKTNRPAAKTPNDIPPAYRKQMSAYRQLVEKIYPQKQVETYILWTNTAQIMPVK